VDLTGSAAKAGPQGVSRIVYFDFDSYSVKADAQPQIEAHAKFIKANPAAKVSWKAIPTSAAAVNTTWPWVKSALKPCAALWACWV
jgi:hypothetical protein